MNNYKCEDCNGGRNCDCPPMIDTGKFSSLKPANWGMASSPKNGCSIAWPEPPPPTILQHLWDYAVGFLAALGAMGLAACVGLYLGGYFEFLVKELAK